jgi:hypothetical protein
VKWPVIEPLGSEKMLLVEDWTLKASKDPANDQLFNFTISGSKTGPDGEGRSDGRFVSKLGRVVVETNDWNVDYAMSLAGINPVPEKFTITWKVEPHFSDWFVSPGVKDAATETTLTLAQGLPNHKCKLEVAGGDTTPIAAIRIYQPPPGGK